MVGHLVFVYGTLKSGEPNHALLQAPNQAKFLGTGTTVARYPLVIASRYNIPYVLDSTGNGERIHGEVYEVDDACLEKLDELEEHPHYYQRRFTDIEMTTQDVPQLDVQFKPGTVLQCEMYILHDFHQKLLELPVHPTYASAGSHGLPYRFREDREATSVYSTKTDVKKESV